MILTLAAFEETKGILSTPDSNDRYRFIDRDLANALNLPLRTNSLITRPTKRINLTIAPIHAFEWLIIQARIRKINKVFKFMSNIFFSFWRRCSEILWIFFFFLKKMFRNPMDEWILESPPKLVFIEEKNAGAHRKKKTKLAPDNRRHLKNCYMHHELTKDLSTYKIIFTKLIFIQYLSNNRFK